MAHVSATIGTVDYAVSIKTAHHQLNADEPAERGGKDSGPTPFELLCAGLCACTAITLRMYAERKQWSLRGVTVDAHYTKKDDKHASIARVLKFDGDLTGDQIARLADIAERTPVTLAVKQGVPVTTTVG